MGVVRTEHVRIHEDESDGRNYTPVCNEREIEDETDDEDASFDIG